MSNLTKETIKINEKSYTVIVEDGALTRENFYTHGQYKESHNYKFGLTKSTFYINGARIQSVDLSNAPSIKTLGQSLFEDENALKTFTFPPYLEKIEAFAFSGTKLSEVILPVTVKEVGNFAFEENSDINVFIAPKTCKFGTNVFSKEPLIFEYKNTNEAEQSL